MCSLRKRAEYRAIYPFLGHSIQNIAIQENWANYSQIVIPPGGGLAGLAGLAGLGGCLGPGLGALDGFQNLRLDLW